MTYNHSLVEMVFSGLIGAGLLPGATALLEDLHQTTCSMPTAARH